MTLTENAIAGRGLIPAGPIRRLIERWISHNPDPREALGPSAGIQLGASGQIAYLADVPAKYVKTLLQKSDDELIPFDVADKIVCALGRFGWWDCTELWEAYKAFDLEPLDEHKPCGVSAL